MQKAVAVFGIFLLFISCNSSKHSSSNRLPSCPWQAEPITIDGSNKDWPSPYPEYDDKAMLGYAVSNDKDNLYITVETGDVATQLKILREGLTVWIDRKGEKDEVTGINFPIPMAAENGGQKSSDRPQGMRAQQSPNGSMERDQKRRMDLEDRVRRTLPEAKEFSLQGFKGCNLQFPIMENDTCGIIVRMNVDADDEMVWEAVVPLKSFYFKSELTRADKGRPISICFETTAMPRPAGQSGGGSGSHGGGGGFSPGIGMGGMGMGMRMGGGGNRGSRNNATNTPDIMEPAYKSTKTYKKFGLAFQ